MKTPEDLLEDIANEEDVLDALDLLRAGLDEAHAEGRRGAKNEDSTFLENSTAGLVDILIDRHGVAGMKLLLGVTLAAAVLSLGEGV